VTEEEEEEEEEAEEVAVEGAKGLSVDAVAPLISDLAPFLPTGSRGWPPLDRSSRQLGTAAGRGGARRSRSGPRRMRPNGSPPAPELRAAERRYAAPRAPARGRAARGPDGARTERLSRRGPSARRPRVPVREEPDPNPGPSTPFAVFLAPQPPAFPVRIPLAD
jgi:hypothetical protein